LYLISHFYKLICIITPTFQYSIIRDGTFTRPCYRWTAAIANVTVGKHVLQAAIDNVFGVQRHSLSPMSL